MLGILLIDKPCGITSHDVVNEIRRRFHLKRVGHAGTLDPLATGVLVVAVGPATRFLQYLPLEPKQYEAEITFGRATTTYDREGEVVLEGTPPDNLAEALAALKEDFTGLVQQVPPMHSAIKLNGKPLYLYARKGETVRRDARTVHIAECETLEVNGPVARIKVTCSGGTYVRTLANDLGERLGCGAHLSGLVRTGVGRFQLAETKPLADVTPSDLIPLSEALLPMPLIEMDAGDVKAIREGRQVRLANIPEKSLVGLLEPNGPVFCVARTLGDALQPECVIPENAVFDAV